MEMFALISSGRVVSITTSEMTLQDLVDAFPQFTIVQLSEGVASSVGDYYNPGDGLFYIDPGFTWLSGTTPPPTTEEAYSSALGLLKDNGLWACQQLRVPYYFEESATWWNQEMEAKAWLADKTADTPMLDEMVAASSGGWVKADLAENISSNAAAWKAASGQILGQLKSKRVALDIIKAEVDGGTKNVMELVNFDTNISVPVVNIEDKYQ